MKYNEFVARYNLEEAAREAAEENARRIAAQMIAEADLTGRKPVKDEDDEFEEDDDEANLLLASSLLLTAMHHLRFYGESQHRRLITISDKAIMVKTADEIESFLEDLNSGVRPKLYPYNEA